MTGKELLKTLQSMDSNELNYIVLIGSEAHGWMQLDSISKDFESKTLDLTGEKNEG